MNHGPRPPRWCREARLCIALVVLCCTAPVVLADGTGTGVLTGLVRDPLGVRLQGVVVEATGARGTRRAVTDSEGRFRFPALEVGGYRVRATLLELSAEEPDVAVFLGRTREVVLVLETGTATETAGPEIGEWIQVIAEAPVIDRFDTRVGANVAFELIDELPVERFYQSVALLLPGVSGGEDGNPNTSGALRSANRFLVDGVDTTDPTTGLFGLNLSYEAIQEVQVTTAAPSVAQGSSGGAVIDVVTRSGGNQYRGGVRWVSGDGGWRDDYGSDPDFGHLRRGIEAANSGPGGPDATLSLNLGGPVLRDRLWFFVAHQDSASRFLRPTLIGTTWDQDTQVEASAFKLTWQPGAGQTVVAQHTRDQAAFVSFDPFSRAPGELQLPEVPAGAMLEDRLFQPLPGEIFALEDNHQAGRFSKLEWSWTRGQNFSLALTLAEQNRELERGPRNRRGLTSDAPHIGAVLDGEIRDTGDPEADLLLFLFNGVTEEGRERRPREQGDLVVDTLLRRGRLEHELSFGLHFQDTESASRLDVAGANGIDRALGIPFAGQLYIDFDLRAQCLLLGQCLPFDPATEAFQPVSLFNFWQRPERGTHERTLAFHLSDTLVAERWVVDLGMRWEAVEGEDQDGQILVEDEDIAPRLAVTYDPKGNGETVLSFAWGRYLEPFLQQFLDGFGRPEPLSGFTEYERRSQVGGIDCSRVDPSLLDSPCWQPVAAVPLFPILPTGPQRRLERSRVNEWVIGYERQVTRELGLSLHWVEREWSDLWNAVARLDAIGDPVLEVRNLDEAERSYRALQVLLQKRFANRWQLLGSYTWSETEGNFFRSDGLGDLADFSQVVETNVVNRLGPAPYDRPHQFGLFTTIRFPRGRSQWTLGSALRYRDGVPWEVRRLEEAGVRFLEPRGARRLGGVFQWDLAATWDLRMASQLELELKAEVFNLSDEQQQLAAETLIDTGLVGLPRTVDDLQTPRTWRFTLGLRF